MLQQVHRRGVAQYMRRDPFAAQRGLPLRGSLSVLRNQALDGIAAERVTKDVREQRILFTSATLS